MEVASQHIAPLSVAIRVAAEILKRRDLRPNQQRLDFLVDFVAFVDRHEGTGCESG